MNDEFTKPRSAIAVSPVIALVIALALSIVLLLLPSAWTAPLKATAAAALLPGQRAALALRERSGNVARSVGRHFHTASQLAEAEAKIARLEAENRQLAADTAARRATETEEPHQPSEGLLAGRTIEARVLGRQARAYLARQELLDAGSLQGVQPDALVLDAAPPLLDRGRDADLVPGRLVLRGRWIWGKVVEVGSHTSVVRRVTEAGYRDVVRLAGPAEPAEKPRFGPQGILEGSSQPLARVRLVGVEKPVEVGDLVYSAATDGVLDEPLLYGRVVRLERPLGAAHWEIWMEPAAAGDDPRQVAILRIELNPRRVGGRRPEGTVQ